MCVRHGNMAATLPVPMGLSAACEEERGGEEAAGRVPNQDTRRCPENTALARIYSASAVRAAVCLNPHLADKRVLIVWTRSTWKSLKKRQSAATT